MKILKLLTCILLVTSTLFAQNKRVEVVVAGGGDVFTIPLGNKGVLLLSQSGKNSYHLEKFSTDLDRTWSLDGNITDGLEFVNYSYDGENAYLLFSRYRNLLYEIVKVNPMLGTQEKYIIQTVDRMDISQFLGYKDGIYIAGVIREQPVLSYTNLRTRQNRLLNSTFNGLAEVQALEVDTTSGQINVTYMVRKGKEYSISLKSFDENGQLISDVAVAPDEDYALLDGRMTALNDSVRVVIGTFGLRNMQSQSRGKIVQGVYICKVTPDEVRPPQYYSFTDFKNFFGYLSQKEQERKQAKIERRKEKGSDLKINTQVLIHEIREKDGQLVLVGEAFNPSFRYNNGFGGGWGNPMMNPWGMGSFGMFPGWGWGMMSMNPWFMSNRSWMMNNNQQIFDGFQYTHAFVAGFDKTNGNMVWDNSFEIDNVRTMSLKEKVKVGFRENELALFYSQKGKIRTKVVKGNLLLDDTVEEVMTTGREGEKVRSTRADDIEFWYDNYCLATGIQRISGGEEGRRNVFYLSKLTF